MDISIVIATRNNASLLAETLQAIGSTVTDGLSWELIVADNGSRDHTPQVVEEYASRLPCSRIFEPQPGQNRARNTALEHVTGRLVVFTDDDVIADPNWLRELHAATQRWPEHAVFGGPIEPRFPEDTPDWIRDPSRCNGGVAFSRYAADAPEGPTSRLPFSPNMAIRRDVLAQYRFDETIGPAGPSYAMGSETEFLERLRAAGHEAVFVPTAKVEHVVRSNQLTLDALFARFYRYGRGRVRRGMHHKAPKWFGAPRTQWKKLPGAWLRYVLSIGQKDEQRFKTGEDYHFLRGTIAEHRRMSRERGAGSGKWRVESGE